MDPCLKAAILRVLQDSEDQLKEFRRRIVGKYLVVFVGNTRDGKSTLVNYMMGAPLKAVQIDNTFKIEHAVVQNGGGEGLGPPIEHGSVSYTTEPELVEFGQDLVLLDSPGFDDNRGPVQEIVNALFVNQIKYAKGVRFVLVSDVRNLANDNINPFLSFLDTVHAIMPNAHKLKQAVSVIFTKDSPHSYERLELIGLLKTKILDVEGLSCNKTLVEHFVRNQHLVGHFRGPSQEGPLQDVGVNVREAILESSPVDVNEFDIKIGISKSARVVLLETYLSFFDDVIALKETFKGFFGGASQSLQLPKDKILGLTDDQLGNGALRELYNGFCAYLEICDVSFTNQIPDALRRLFLVEVRKITSSIRQLGVTLPVHRINEGKIEDVHEKLDHISLIEQVLETNSKSKQIVMAYHEYTEDFWKKMHHTCEDLEEECSERAQLTIQILTVPEIITNLNLLTDDYLLASHAFELQKMSRDLEHYIAVSNDILECVTKRPCLEHKLNREISELPQVNNNVKRKLDDIQNQLKSRECEAIVNMNCPMHKLLGTIVFCMGWTFVASLSKVNQLKTFAGSFLLFAAFSWKSRSMRKIFWRYQLRYKQKRLLSSHTVVNDCWKNLIPEAHWH